jgi:outer membrane murein-binding lipoprotein Lpp
MNAKKIVGVLFRVILIIIVVVLAVMVVIGCSSRLYGWAAPSVEDAYQSASGFIRQAQDQPTQEVEQPAVSTPVPDTGNKEMVAELEALTKQVSDLEAEIVALQEGTATSDQIDGLGQTLSGLGQSLKDLATAGAGTLDEAVQALTTKVAQLEGRLEETRQQMTEVPVVVETQTVVEVVQTEVPEVVEEVITAPIVGFPCNDEIIVGWDDRSAGTVTMTLADGYGFFKISSDPALVNGFDTGGRGFVAIVYGDVEMSTGWNEANQHYNVSACMFPEGSDAMFELREIQDREKKELVLWIDDEGTVTEVDIEAEGFTPPHTGGGENPFCNVNIIDNWENPSAGAVTMTLQPGFGFFTISSDPGVVNGVSSGNYGFLAVVHDNVTLATSWNERNGHYNVSACMHPSDASSKVEIMKLQESERKPSILEIDAEGNAEWLLQPASGN